MTVKIKQQIELQIEKVVFGGKGLARIDGFAVFVDNTIPGDRVLARIVKKKKNFAEARVLELLQPAPDRVQAPCLYSGYCGGCKWQFLPYEKQLLYKQHHVRDSLEHIGLIHDTRVHPTIPSGAVFGYRNKMEFSCAARRWLMPEDFQRQGVDRSMAIGLHVPGTFDKVLDIERCLLQQELGNQLLGKVRRFARASSLPPYGLRSHEGYWRFVVLRYSAAHDQWMVNLVTRTDERAAIQPLADALIKDHPQVVSVVNNITARKAGVAMGETQILLAGEPVLVDRIGSYEFEISANSFFQTNTGQAKVLYDVVCDYAGLTGGQTVFDLYCGAGTISIYLSSMAGRVVGFEMIDSAVTDAETNCRRNHIGNCRFIGGDLRRTLPLAGERPDVMVVDPPRAGMHKDVVKTILALNPQRIVYVSCNPATMARDLLYLKQDYRIAGVQPVDMFPHTYHIESVARLERF